MMTDMTATETAELDERFIKASLGISKIPELISLLYDLDLMPEQIVSNSGKRRLILIVESFRAFEERLKKSIHFTEISEESARCMASVPEQSRREKDKSK